MDNNENMNNPDGTTNPGELTGTPQNPSVPPIPGLVSSNEPANIEVKSDLPDFPDLDQVVDEDPAAQTDSFHKGGTGAGTEQVQTAMGSNQEAFVLCPYCGHVQSGGDKCEQCHGLFEPLSRRATQISMGPWFIRDKNKPFMPGFSFAVLQKMVRSGKIKETTVLRGPSTRQFWSVAKNIPGIAHLLGICHSCGKPLENAGTNGMIPGTSPVEPPNKCPHCGVLFPTPGERNELGLMYKTENEARQAKVALDKELDALYGKPEPQAPGAAPSPGATPPAQNAPAIPGTPGAAPVPGTPAAAGNQPNNDLLSQILGPIHQWQDSEGSGADASAPSAVGGAIPGQTAPPAGMPNMTGPAVPQAVSGTPGAIPPQTPVVPGTPGAQPQNDLLGSILGTPGAGAPTTGAPGLPGVPGVPGVAGVPGTPPAPGTPGMPAPGITGAPMGVPGVNAPNPLANAAPGIPAPPAARKSSISNMTWALIIINVLLVGCLVAFIIIRGLGGNPENPETPNQTQGDDQNANGNTSTAGGSDNGGLSIERVTPAGTTTEDSTDSDPDQNKTNRPSIQPGVAETPLFNEPDLGNPEIIADDDYTKWDADYAEAIDLATKKPAAALKLMQALPKPVDEERSKDLKEKIKMLEDYIKKAKSSDPKFMGL